MLVEVLKLEKLDSLKEIYAKVGEYLYKKNYVKNSNVFCCELIEREKQGSLKVYEDFYLPHIISENIKVDIVLKLEGQRNKFLFLLLGLKESSHKNQATKIVEFLLDRSNVDELFSMEKKTFINKIKFI